MPMTLKDMMMRAREKVQEISPADVKKALESKEVILLDVREEDEFVEGHVDGAVSAPRGFLELQADPATMLANKAFAGKHNAQIVTYCAQGPGARQLLSAVTLKEMGYENVRVMSGGMKAWKEAGLPIATGGDDD
jgi:rhodanese-related sulfurtransferase